MHDGPAAGDNSQPTRCNALRYKQKLDRSITTHVGWSDLPYSPARRINDRPFLLTDITETSRHRMANQITGIYLQKVSTINSYIAP